MEETIKQTIQQTIQQTIKQTMKSVNSETTTILKEKKKPKPRCSLCKKKLKMTELLFVCKCDKRFCQLHLTPHSHTCTFNYLKERQDLITQKNPKMCIQSLEVK
jgi:hypothetical protein